MALDLQLNTYMKKQLEFKFLEIQRFITIDSVYYIAIVMILTISGQIKAHEIASTIMPDRDNQAVLKWDDHHIFTRTEAENWLQEYSVEDEFYNRKKNTQLYKKYEAYADDIYKKYQELLKEEVAKFPPRPHIFIRKDEGGSYSKNIRDGKSTNIIALQIKDESEGDIYAILAHEMAHYILNHGNRSQETLDKEVSAYFDASTGHDLNPDCWNRQRKNIVGENSLKELFKSLQIIGDFGMIHDDSTPLPIIYEKPEGMEKVLIKLAKESRKWGQCKQVGNALEVLYDQTRKICNIKKGTCDLSEKGLKDFKAASSRARKALLDCYQDVDIDLVKLMFKHDETNWGNIESSYIEMLEEETKLEDLDHHTREVIKVKIQKQNPYLAFLKIEILVKSKIQNELKKLGLELNNFSYISTEDEADILSTLILIDSPYPLSAEQVWLKRLNEEDKKECSYNHKSPRDRFSQGFRYADHHHSECYRAWRAGKIRLEINTPTKKEKLIRFILESNPSIELNY